MDWQRSVFDWTPEDGDREAWLDALGEQGWEPDMPTGAEVVVNGRPVVRFALRRHPPGPRLDERITTMSF